MTMSSRLLPAVGLLVLAAILLTFPFAASGYQIYIINLVLVWVVMSLGLNILMGETGLFGMAHVAFYGIGIYTTGLLTNNTGVPVLLAIFLAGCLAALIGFILGVLSIRMNDIYLGLSTFAFGEAMQWVFHNWDAVTKGVNGLRISPTTFFGWRIDTDFRAYFVALGIATTFTIGAVLLSRSRFGRAMRAVRESEPAAAAVGINIRRVKVSAFAISAFYAGSAGGLITIFTSYIHPDTLGFNTTIVILTMLVVGGMGTIPGAIIGAAAIGVLSEFLRQAADRQEMIYGLVLVLFMVFLPDGIYGRLRQLWRRWSAQ